jgi:hypothetical protein
MSGAGYRWLVPLILLLTNTTVFAQETSEETKEARQLETLTEKNDAEPEDDSYEQDQENWKRHPLDLNQASADELYGLRELTALQIDHFLLYRKLLGRLLNIYELQAIPGWDLATIREILPYIKVGKDESFYSAVRDRWRGGDASVLLRAGRVLEKSAGYEKTDSGGPPRYTGSPQKIFFRYTYNDKQLLQYGIIGEKDAGEPFLKGAQRYGFDFYSFHFFLRNTGMIKDLALGDFTVNLGQGLIQWQTIAFTKGGSVLAIKRQASRLRPYHSAGEFNFHRGCGITLKKGNWSSTAFLSFRKISSNTDTDTSGREDIFTSFENSGYHRTVNEIADRNNNQQFSAGGNLSFSRSRLSLSANFIHFRFSNPFLKKDAPYNLYSFKGRRLSNASFDYSYTWRNMHLFGELAVDQAYHMAVVQGALLSLSADLDVSVLYRHISHAYQSLYADAYTENSTPVNEKGLYAGLSARPFSGLQLDIYYDLFVFPWLKYRLDAPSAGNDFSVLAAFQPDKNWFLHLLYKRETKAANQEATERGPHPVLSQVKERWQIETGYKCSRSVSLNSRLECIRIGPNTAGWKTGFLGSVNLAFSRKKSGGNIGLTRFETSDYDSRVFVYESDMLYNFSLPVYYGKGFHYHINVHRNFGRFALAGKQLGVTAWLKWGQTYYPGSLSIGSGLDKIPGSRKSEIKVQLLLGRR